MEMIGNHSPNHSPDNLQSRRLPPWNQVVRGESESIAAVSSSEESFPIVTAPVDDSTSAEVISDNGGERNGGTGKRPAWNRSSGNGGVSEVQPVMDARSWPALSDSARGSTKSESSKGLLDGSSVSPWQVCFCCDSL